MFRRKQWTKKQKIHSNSYWWAYWGFTYNPDTNIMCKVMSLLLQKNDMLYFICHVYLSVNHFVSGESICPLQNFLQRKKGTFRGCFIFVAWNRYNVTFYTFAEHYKLPIILIFSHCYHIAIQLCLEVREIPQYTPWEGSQERTHRVQCLKYDLHMGNMSEITLPIGGPLAWIITLEASWFPRQHSCVFTRP